MVAKSNKNPNAGGGQKGLIIPAILTLILIAGSTIMGCNGRMNPMDVGMPGGYSLESVRETTGERP